MDQVTRLTIVENPPPCIVSRPTKITVNSVRYMITMPLWKRLLQKVIKSVEDTYISETCHEYIGFMGVKIINLIHHLMYRYGKTTETYPKENQKRFNEALDIKRPIEKYFKRIKNCI